MLDRRAFLGSSLFGAAALAGCTGSFLAPRLSAGAIDMHAHVFNGRDIPVMGFLNATILRSSHEPVRDPDMLTAGFIEFLRAILLSGTPTAAQEAATLRRGAVLRTAGDLVRQDEENVARGIAAYAEAAPALRARGQAPDRVMARLMRETGLAGGAARLRTQQGLPEEAARRIFERDPAASAREGRRVVYQRNSPFMQTLRWAGLLTRARGDLVSEMVRLYGQPDQIRAFCPSFVDFTSWYDYPEPVSPIEDQIEVMSLLARRRTDTVLLNFVPFCPLRAALEREDGRGGASLARIGAAVMDRGFVGVKLYPPIGFKPLGNEETRFKGVARAPRGGGAALDEELRALYRWCRDHEVPIKAHANNSMDRDECTGLHASPSNWRRVLEAYRGLRLNLAHVGGFDAATADGRCAPGDTRPWEELSAELARRHRHLYVDVGYWTEAMSGVKERERVLGQMRTLIATTPVMAERIMYGSDWSMIGRVPGHEAYLAEIRSAAGELGLGDDWLRRFEGGNARRFLGLYPGERPFERLSRFFGPEHPFTRIFGV